MHQLSVESIHIRTKSNAYLLQHRRTVLINTGEATSGEELRAELYEAGVTLADIDEVLLTHWPPTTPTWRP